MAKKKSQKRKFSSTENPFNIKINRNKHNVLGQRLKGTRGLPGVSHSVGNAKRKEMFYKKKLMSQKANQYVDKRLMSSSLTADEQSTIRFIRERKKKLKRNIFNLNDDETLTHRGMDIDKGLKNDAIIDSDDEPLDAKFINQTHFGGFTNDSTSVTKSRKEIIDDLIADSKKRKYEKKLANELNADLIEKLDKEWKIMHSSIPAVKSRKPKEISVSEKNDPFDVVLKELKFDMRTAPAARTKTPEEIEKEEREKMKELEEERHKRMINPMDNTTDRANHFSADSIYDGIDIQFEPVIEHEVDKETHSEGLDSESDDDDSSNADDSEDECNDVHEIGDIHSAITTENDSEIPDSIKKFYDILENEEEKDVSIIIENILKSNIKNKTKENMKKLEMFFAVLIEYVIKISSSAKKSFEVLDSVMPHLYTLAEISPNVTGQKFLEFLDKEQEVFQKSKGQKLKKNFPRLNCLVLFKICSTLYSVSDFKHPIVTPAVIFMCDIISSGYANSFLNIYFRIIICEILYNCVSYSKRYIPEVIYFLNKVLSLTTDKSKKFNLAVDLPIDIKEITEISEKKNNQCDDSTKLPSFHEIFSESVNICSKLSTLDYPNYLKDILTKFTTTVESVKHVYEPLVYENQKPVPLKLFEPAFHSKYTVIKDDIKKKHKLIKSVGQKIRKEEKGLLREMRRDNQVIASEKLKEKLAADEERKRKVKQIYQELSMQEGEYKKFMKKS